MAFAQKNGNGWTILSPSEPVRFKTIGVGYEALAQWSDDELAAWGIHTVGEGDPVPDGKRVVSSSVGDRDGLPVWVNVLEDIPVDPYANYIPVHILRQRLEVIGMFDAVAAYLSQRPAQQMKVLSLEVGVDPGYPDLNAAFDEMDVPQVIRDYILAPPSAGVGEPPSVG